MIGLILWAGAGLVAGIAGRLLLPGSPLGWPAALLAGLLGGLAGGFASTVLNMGGVEEIDPRGLVLAFLTAALAVILVQLVRVRRERPNS